MKDKFYIDRQFGQAIWVDVKRGIVQKCYGESEKFNARMNELYIGKSITFLNEDFIGRAMAGTYHHLRCDSITCFLLSVSGIESNIRNVKSKIAHLNRISVRKEYKKDMITEYLKECEGYETKLYDAKKILENEKKRILTEHNFIL